MERVSVRQFQLKASKFLPTIPLILTQYGRDIAIISPIPIGAQLYIAKKHGKNKTPTIPVIPQPEPRVIEDHIDSGTPPPPPASSIGIMPKEPRPNAYSTIVYCPHCNEPVWKEYANQHYMENHEV